MKKSLATRSRILAEGLSLVSQHGFEGTSFGVLADHIGMSKSGLYAHFRNKDELQIDILQAAARVAEQQVMEPTLKRPPGLARLRFYFDRLLGWTTRAALPGGCPFVTASIEFDDKDGPVRDYVVATTEAFFAFMRRLVDEAVEAGDLEASAEGDVIAWRLMGIYLVHQMQARLFKRTDARKLAMASFDDLLRPFQTPRPGSPARPAASRSRKAVRRKGKSKAA